MPRAAVVHVDHVQCYVGPCPARVVRSGTGTAKEVADAWSPSRQAIIAAPSNLPGGASSTVSTAMPRLAKDRQEKRAGA